MNNFQGRTSPTYTQLQRQKMQAKRRRNRNADEPNLSEALKNLGEVEVVNLQAYAKKEIGLFQWLKSFVMRALTRKGN